MRTRYSAVLQKNHWFTVSIWIALVLGLSSCKTATYFDAGSATGIKKEWAKLHLDNRYHVGLSIYDVKAGKSIFGFRDDNYFTPASNVKILTMYAALHLLDEHLVAAYYKESGDSLIIWGGGDPGTNYPDVDSAGALVRFIANTNKQVFFSNDHFKTTRYGKGWAWDDYNYGFQAERHAYPIYGNHLWIRREGTSLFTKPAYLRPFISLQSDTVSRLVRKEGGESFLFHYNQQEETEIAHIPIAFLKTDIAQAWTEATGKYISMSAHPFKDKSHIVSGSPRDTLLRIMMQESDNFIAEQLLLACSMAKLGYMDETAIIDEIRHTLLSQVDDYFQWVDGSGLSRYNLMTPRSIVDVLRNMYLLKGFPYLKAIFPAGGKSGNIKAWYGSDRGEPFVFAKSGTLRNQHCLSGYLVTRKGNVLIFSFMHNQFMEEPDMIRSAMEKLFDYLYDKY